MRLNSTHAAARAGQRGLARSELLAAAAIAALLVVGLYGGARYVMRACLDAGALAELADRERLALTVIAEAIESSGDESPADGRSAATPPAGTGAASSGPALSGTMGSQPGAETLSARGLPANADAPRRCVAGKEDASSRVSTLTFSVDASLGLMCSLNGAAPTVLAAGVEGLRVLYGVKTDFGAGNSAPDSYLTAAQMTSDDWHHVVVVNVTLLFRPPLASRENPPGPIAVERAVAVMARAGVSG